MEKMAPAHTQTNRYTLTKSMLLFRTFATLIILFSLGFTTVTQAMTTIFVGAEPEAGRYQGPIYVKLTASDPEAKIWYTCKRNGTPSDLLKYEKPILLEKSCALVYFAYVTTEIESKIDRSDYTILYSDDVKLETENQILSLRNTGTSTVDVGEWEVIAGTGAITIPAGTTILPGAKYTIGSVTPASYELKSPEGYMKSQVAVAPKPAPAPAPATKVATKPTPSVATVTPTSTIETAAQPTPTAPPVATPSAPTTPIAASTPEVATAVTSSNEDSEASTLPATPPSSGPTSTNGDSNLKASSIESSNVQNIGYAAVILFLLGLAGWALRRTHA